eukprot:4255452-Amphidinium_carterae.1
MTFCPLDLIQNIEVLTWYHAEATHWGEQAPRKERTNFSGHSSLKEQERGTNLNLFRECPREIP